MIKDGAILIDSCDTIISALQFCTNKVSNNIFSDSSILMKCDKFVDDKNIEEDYVDDIKKLILNMLNYSPISIEQIVQELDDVNISTILVALVDLDLEGKIERNFMNEICLMVEYSEFGNEVVD